MTQGSPLVRVCRFGLAERSFQRIQSRYFEGRAGLFALRDPRPAGVRQPKAAQQFLDVPQFDQSFFLFDRDAVHQAFGAVSQRDEFFVGQWWRCQIRGHLLNMRRRRAGSSWNRPPQSN